MLKLSINGYELEKTERFIMLSAYDNWKLAEPTEEKIDLQECSLNEIRMIVFGEHPAEANQYLEEQFGITGFDISLSQLMELTGLNKAEEKQMWIEFLEGK
jgi:hypothetical protein